VLVVQKGKTIYQKSFGMADREWEVPNTNQTKYRIGSVTKQFTAASIL
jgi:CubicO group peptidase (beta-lactamase class C family)